MRLLIKITAGVVFVSCALTGAILWFGDPLMLKSPQDLTLLGTFNDHRRAFDRLCQMATDDLPHESYFGMSNLDKLSVERQQEYRKLISEISSGLVITVDYDFHSEIHLRIWRTFCDQSRVVKGARVCT